MSQDHGAEVVVVEQMADKSSAVMNDHHPVHYYTSRVKGILKSVLSIDAIVMNILALLLCCILLVILNQKNMIPSLGKYHHFLYQAVELLACLQVCRSAKRSLFLPVLLMLLAGVLMVDGELLKSVISISLDMLKQIMLLGIIGMCVSIFNIR